MKCDYSSIKPCAPEVGRKVLFSVRSRRSHIITDVPPLAFAIGHIGSREWFDLSAVIYEAREIEAVRASQQLEKRTLSSRIVALLRDGRPRTRTEFAEELGHDPCGVTIALGRLRCKQQVTRIPPPATEATWAPVPTK